jgi:pimeloyl-ACP methyl ester carboxylesterase
LSLVHSSVAGARQWRHLMDNLKTDFRVRAVNLFGYGKTPPWPTTMAQSLDVLLETNPFYLLAQSGRTEAFAEAMELRNCIKQYGALGQWAVAAEKFADYWNGPSSWRDMSPERQTIFAEMLKPNFSERDAVTDETTSVEEWARLLPRATLQVSDPETVLPIREIATILRRSCPEWDHTEVPGVGHMAPLTRPGVIDPIVRSYLEP